MAKRRGRRRQESFGSYLNSMSLRTYVRDYVTSEGHRAAVGVVVGLLFLGYGLVRTVTHPEWRSVGVVLVGLGVAMFCLVAPLLVGLGYALVGRGEDWVARRNGS